MLLWSFCSCNPSGTPYRALTFRKALFRTSHSESPEISCSKGSDRTFGVSHGSPLGGSGFYPHVVSGCMFLFGVATIAQGTVRGYSGLLATRFLLGLFESSVFSGCVYLIAM